MEVGPVDLYEFLQQKLPPEDRAGMADLERLLEVIVLRVPSVPQTEWEPAVHRVCSDTRTGNESGDRSGSRSKQLVDSVVSGLARTARRPTTGRHPRVS